jgi:hypothetical protein
LILITNKLSAFGVSVVVAFAAVLVLLVASPLTASADKGTATAKVVTIANSTTAADQAITVKGTHVSGKAACSEGTMSSVANKTVGGAVTFVDIACGTTSTTVSIAPTVTATSITVASTTGFPDSGSILIGNGTGQAVEEILDYTSKTKTTIDGLTRARAGTAAVAHASGATLYPVIYSQIQTAAGVIAASTTIELTDGSNVVFDTAGAQIIFSPGKAIDDAVLITGRTGNVITHVAVGGALAHPMGNYAAQISGANTDSATATFVRTASTTTTGSFQFKLTITAGAAQASSKADVEITLVTDKPVATAAAATVASTDVVAIPVIVSLNGTDDTEVSTGVAATQFFAVTVLPLKGVLGTVSAAICTDVLPASTRVVGAVMTNCASTVIYTPLIGATGSDTFTFTLTNGGEVSAAQTATITLPAAPAPVVVVTDVGGFTDGAGATQVIATGTNLVLYGGGTVAELEADGLASGATSISVTVDGAYITLVIGAPAFANAAFTAQFPDGVTNGTIIQVTKVAVAG